MKYKTLSNPSAKLSAELSNLNRNWFDTKIANDILAPSSRNAVKKLLFDMVQRGLILRIKDGVYYIIPYDYDPQTYMPDWHLLAEPLTGGNHYIGYYSAMQIHNLTTQPSLVEQIVVDKPIRPTKVEVKNAKLQFIYHSEKHFFGYEKVWIDGFNKVFCSDLEKTFVDSLFQPHYSGGVVEIGKALYFTQKKIDFEKLIGYVDKFSSIAVLKRLGYLLELFEIENPIIESLQSRMTKSVVPLDTSLPKQGKISSRWGILQNADIETIKTSIYS